MNSLSNEGGAENCQDKDERVPDGEEDRALYGYAPSLQVVG
jgi:hypothetical protein